jgi:hypothetical protein
MNLDKTIALQEMKLMIGLKQGMQNMFGRQSGAGDRRMTHRPLSKQSEMLLVERRYRDTD